MVSTGFGLGISHQHSHPVSNSAPQGSLAIRKNSILQWCTGGNAHTHTHNAQSIYKTVLPYWLLLLPSSYLYDNTGILQCVSIHVGTINSQPWMIQLLPAKKPWHKTSKATLSYGVLWCFHDETLHINSSKPKQIMNIHDVAKQAHLLLLKQTKTRASRIEPLRKRDPDCDRLVWNAQRFSFCPIWTQPGVKA